MFYTFLLGGCIGLWASVFSLALTEPGEVFSFVGRFFLWLDGKFKNPNQGVYFSIKKIVYYCPKCHGGQLAFWLYFLWAPRYNPWEHFVMIAPAVFIGWLMENLYKQWQQF